MKRPTIGLDVVDIIVSAKPFPNSLKELPKSPTDKRNRYKKPKSRINLM